MVRPPASNQLGRVLSSGNGSRPSSFRHRGFDAGGVCAGDAASLHSHRRLRLCRQQFHIQHLDWNTVKWSFTSFHYANWDPLSWLSHALDIQFFGLDPGRHHETSLLLHAMNALLLFWLLLQATGYVGRSFVAAALFALHPCNVEAVAWVAERKTVLSMVFFLLTLMAYRWYARRPAVGRYLVVAMLFALGLMSKPQIVTLPFVLLLWDYWPLGRMFASSSARLWPGRRRATVFRARVFPGCCWRNCRCWRFPPAAPFLR